MSKKLTYQMLSEQERVELRRDWERIGRVSDLRSQSQELLNKAGTNFDAAYEAAEKGKVHKYFVRAGFGAGAALLGLTGQLLAKLADFGDEPSVIQKLLKKYQCSEVNFSSFPKDF